MKSIIAILLLLVYTLCSAIIIPDKCGQLNEDYLYNEQMTTGLDEFPWIGKIAHTKDDKSTVYPCQAILISKRYLTTVAHCFVDKQLSAYAVILGNWNTSNNIAELLPKQYEIEEIILHPNYKPLIVDNDIALLRLASEVAFSNYTQPICLPATGAPQLMASFYYFAGFGRNIVEEHNSLQKFKTVSHIVSRERCKVALRNVQITENSICANCLSKIDIRSGTVLMDVRFDQTKPKYFYLIGLLSSGSGFCDPSHMAAFTNISLYLDWMAYNMV